MNEYASPACQHALIFLPLSLLFSWSFKLSDFYIMKYPNLPINYIYLEITECHCCLLPLLLALLWTYSMAANRSSSAASVNPVLGKRVNYCCKETVEALPFINVYVLIKQARYNMLIG